MGQNGGWRPGAGRPKGAKNKRTHAKALGQQRALEREAMNAEAWMREVAHVARSRVSRLFDAEGRLRPVTELPDHVDATVASIKTLKTNVVSGDGRQEETREVKLWDKLRALELVGRHLGLLAEKHEVAVSGQLELVAAALDRMKERNRGQKQS